MRPTWCAQPQKLDCERTRNSIRNAAATLRPELPRDKLARGIWANKIGKVALNLWHVRWRNLPIKDRLISRGMIITGECTLCDTEMESIDHLFFGCDYAKWVLREAMEATSSLVNKSGINSFEEAAYELNKVTPGSPAWGLQWNMIGIVIFHIWKQQNQRRMLARADPKQELLKRYIVMAEVGFEEGKFKRKNKNKREQHALLQWDALLMLIHEGDGGRYQWLTTGCLDKVISLILKLKLCLSNSLF